jgi:hypothetical protein
MLASAKATIRWRGTGCPADTTDDRYRRRAWASAGGWRATASPPMGVPQPRSSDARLARQARVRPASAFISEGIHQRKLRTSAEGISDSLPSTSQFLTLTERGLSPPARREAPPRRQCPLRASADVALGRQPAAPGSEPPRPRRQRRRDRPLRPRLPGRVVLVANRRCLWRSGRVPACARRRVELQLGRDPSAAVRSPTRWVFLGAAPALVCAVVNAGCEPPREGALIAALSGLLGDAGTSRAGAGLRFGRRCCALRVGHGRGACPWLRSSRRVARASSSSRRRSWARRSSLTRRSLREFLGLGAAGGSVRAR